MAIQDVPDEMLACQVVEFNKPYKIHKVATPKELGDHDLLVKVAVASLCHTDGMVTAGTFGTKLPCTASHEGTGTVVAKGSEAHDFQVGDRVMCGIYRNPCGVCLDCQGPENFRQYCSKMMGAIGIHLDGAFAEYVVADARHACRLPDKITFETAAPLACAGCTIWRGVLQAELKKGEWLCLVGSGGGLGHLGVQFGKALGLNVIGVDAREEGLGLTKQAGADVVVDARKGDDHVVAEIHRVTSGAGADATVNVSDAPTAAATACAATKRHGTMIQIAQPDIVGIPMANLIFRDIRVKGSLICSPEEARRMLDVVVEHGISVTTNPVHGLREIPKLVDLAHGGHMKGKGIVIVDEKQIEEEKRLGASL